MKKIALFITLIFAVGLQISRASGVDAKYKTPQTQNVAALTTNMSVTQNGNFLVFSMPDGPEPIEIYSGSTLVWTGNPADGYILPINSASWPAGTYYAADPRHGRYIFQITWEASYYIPIKVDATYVLNVFNVYPEWKTSYIPNVFTYRNVG